MTDPISNLESMVAAALANQQGPTAEQIRELINGLRQLADVPGHHRGRRGVARETIRGAGEHHPEPRLCSDRAGPSTMAGCRQGADRTLLLESLPAAPDAGGVSQLGGHHVGRCHRSCSGTDAGPFKKRAVGSEGDGRGACAIGQDRKLHRSHLQGCGCRIQAHRGHRWRPQQPPEPDATTNRRGLRGPGQRTAVEQAG